ncbi:sugar transferase [Macrococcus capreoli]
MNKFQESIKRSIDISISSIALIILSPIFLYTAYRVKHEDNGPILFIQKRSGKNDIPFNIYKFRSMYVKKVGPTNNASFYDEWTDKVPDDFIFKTTSYDNPNVTKIGKIIRKYSIDELPQLINVLKGDMSIVGPRPEIIEITNKYDNEQRKRLYVKPGITGWAQVNGRSEIPHGEKIKYDLYYINHQSIMLDIKIIWMTFWQVIKGTGSV